MAKSFFFFPGEPVATIAATTESHPLMNYFSGQCLLQAIGGSEKRLGSLWLKAQLQAMKAQDPMVEMVLSDVEGKLEDRINVERLRRDQCLMYALLGDPATRLRLPDPLKASVRRTASGWHWEAERPDERAHLEIGYRPVGRPPARGKTAPANREDALNAYFAADAAINFTPLPDPPEGRRWEGTMDRPGFLRLVATSDRKLYAVVLKLQ
jgi:hypothetical protein